MALFDVKAAGNLAAVFQKTARLGPGDFRTAFRRTANAWLLFIEEGFIRERDPYGNMWIALSPVTVKRKQRKGVEKPEAILQETGELRDSFFYTLNRTGFSVGTNRVFPGGNDANFHQYGGTTPSGNSVPPREMLPFDGLPDEWIQVAEGYLGDDLDNVLRDASA